MAFIIAGIVAFVTVVMVCAIAFADGMSDAPSEEGISVWPTLIVGFGLAGVLIGTHFLHISW